MKVILFSLWILCLNELQVMATVTTKGAILRAKQQTEDGRTRNEENWVSWVNHRAAKSTNKQLSCVNPDPLKKRCQKRILSKWEGAGKDLENCQAVMQVCLLRREKEKLDRSVWGCLGVHKPKSAIRGATTPPPPTQAWSEQDFFLCYCNFALSFPVILN